VPGTVGFLTTDTGRVTYLQWQADGRGGLSGTVLEAVADGAPPTEQVRTRTGPLGGRIDGSAITLDIADHTDQGVLAADGVTLNVVQPDGSIRSVDYRRATAADYNTALSRLRQTVDAANSQEQQQVSQANLQTAAQRALSALQVDNKAFTNAKAVRDDLAKADADLQQERRDIAGGNGENCYNVQVTVAYDAQMNVGYDVTTSAAYDVKREQDALDSARSHARAVRDAEAALRSAGLPATPGADVALATAQQQDAQAVATTNGAIDRLNADLAAAYGAANSAGTGECAGVGPGDPPPGLSRVS
jgi:hypothetical protein